MEVTDVEVMLPNFSYTATDPHGLVENEHCPVYRAVIVDSAVMRPDPDEVMDYQWLLAGSDRDCRADPGTTQPVGGRSGQGLASSTEAAWRQPAPSGIQDANVTTTLASVTHLLRQQIDELALLWRELGGRQAPRCSLGICRHGWMTFCSRAVSGCGRPCAIGDT